MIVISVIVTIIVAFLILHKPYLGIVFTAASVPIADVLPQVPLASSIVPIMGAITLAGFLWHRKNERDLPLFRLSQIHLLGLLFIFWIFVSNPQAAWFGRDRNWIFTFAQLWVLFWLAGELLDTPKKQHLFMWVFSGVTMISAFIAIQQGGFGDDIDPLIRASGLAQGANTAARYFVIAIVFFNYLRIVHRIKFLAMLSVLGMLVTFFGVFATASRTGMLLLLAALGLMALLQKRFKYSVQVIIVFMLALAALLTVSDQIAGLFETIMPAVIAGTDTIGLRYKLWEAGILMWNDHILGGVGVGMYRWELYKYAQTLLAPRYWQSTTHNTYIQVLAETGIVGFIIFISLIIATLKNYFSVTDGELVGIRNAWVVIFATMLLGAITKSDQADKMLWLIMGISVYYRNHPKFGYKKDSISKKADDSFVRPKRRVVGY